MLVQDELEENIDGYPLFFSFSLSLGTHFVSKVCPWEVIPFLSKESIDLEFCYFHISEIQTLQSLRVFV